MNVLNRSNNVINILRQTISHKNDLLIFSRYSFNYYSKYYTTKGPKTEEITDTLTMNATTENTSVNVPNYRDVWSRSQRSRLDVIKGPRFEQTDLEAQVTFLKQPFFFNIFIYTFFNIYIYIFI